MNAVDEIITIMKDQEGRMLCVLNGERIIEREYHIDVEKMGTGVAKIITGPRRCDKSIFQKYMSKLYRYQQV
ncbi:MAG: hypothetical protein JRN37_01785 [Nitrososphaerota archaeon]|nr:hypothetical protein [Nitrososphaerota archaeon]MDG7037883.1 hypothetical protein [Nitrososphaerota archaeon]MDG7042772.1 hypothetical protein [Nitrososphaerota archaeon]